jgi:alpha,alpha-trehalose phosphorylase
MWADIGFWRTNGGDPSFHIHGVTGPDEYTTVVNNNLFTNVMARHNLERTVAELERIAEEDPGAHAQIVARLGVTDDEVEEWARCAAGMTIPFDEGLGIHPQDDFFLDREVWDLSNTPMENRPLLLHYHPLVIYRFQVLKQADVVMALFLQGDRFTAEEKRADFEYYDPITTGDSTLSAVVQSIMAAEVGYHEDAWRYFLQGLYVDLMNLHENTVDGMHIASAGGVWRAIVNGFAGLRDGGGRLSFDPRLPDAWREIRFPLCWRGSRLRVTVSDGTLEVANEGDSAVSLDVRGTSYDVDAGATLAVELDGHGPRIDGRLGDKPLIGGTRADGTTITAGVPDPIPFEDHQELDPHDVPLVEPR